MSEAERLKRPLKGIRVVELAGLAPVPFLGLLLATYGASVVRIDRPASLAGPVLTADTLTAHKEGSIPLNLKLPASIAVLHSLLDAADILLDPFRPGILERLLGLSNASELLRRYPRLILVRLTGFRRDGKWRDRAGHDINYLAVSGVLSLLGGPEDRGPPMPPANLLADFAGGGLNAFAGTLLALIQRGINTGKGSIVDANMVDGSGFLATFARLGMESGSWVGPRGTNLLDGGCPFYACYECRDQGRYVAVGALEPQFFDQLLDGMGLQERDVLGPEITTRFDQTGWPFMKSVFEKRFREQTRNEWEEIFQGRDACVTPVKEMAELKAEEDMNRIPFNLQEARTMPQGSGNERRDHPPDGIGWTTTGMEIGHMAGSVLHRWLGWEKDEDWTVGQGGAVQISESRKSRL